MNPSLELSLDLAAMDGGHAENAGAFFGHANEVFSSLKAASPLTFIACSTIYKICSNVSLKNVRQSSRASAQVRFMRLKGMDANESYRGEASDYKAQLCAQLNDTQLC